jgi:benzoate membrane transport protein
VQVRERFERYLPTIGAAVPLIVIFIAVLSVPLTAAGELGLSSAETASWILVVYAIPGLLSLALAFRYRQPLLMTGNIFALIFVVSLGNELSYAEIVGAYMLAGGVILIVDLLGLSQFIASLIPGPVVLGLLVGAILPFVTDIFVSLGEAPVLIAATLSAYLLSRRLFGERLPAVLPALLAGLLVTGATGQFGSLSTQISFPEPVVTRPAFSLRAIATATPVLVVLIDLQANLPSLIYLQGQDYEPPERRINMLSGLGTILSSLLGPTGISLSLPATALVGGEQAGEKAQRHNAVYLAGVASILIGVLAPLAAVVPDLIPRALLLTVAGLAMFNVLANTITQIFRGPLILGPLFALATALAEFSLLGFGSFFWALVLGTGVSSLLEKEAMRQLETERSHERG